MADRLVVSPSLLHQLLVSGEPLETLHAALQKFTIFVVEQDWAKFSAWVEQAEVGAQLNGQPFIAAATALADLVHILPGAQLLMLKEPMLARLAPDHRQKWLTCAASEFLDCPIWIVPTEEGWPMDIRRWTPGAPKAISPDHFLP